MNYNIVIKDNCPVCDGKLNLTSYSLENAFSMFWQCPQPNHYLLDEVYYLSGLLMRQSVNFHPGTEWYLFYDFKDPDHFNVYKLDEQNEMWLWIYRMPAFFVKWNELDKLSKRLFGLVMFS